MEYQDCQPSLWFTEIFSTPLNRWMEFHKTWQEAKSQPPQPSFCFWDDWKTTMACHASDLLRIFRLLVWNRWMEFNKSWQEASTQRPPPNLCFSGAARYQHTCMFLSKKRFSGIQLWTCGPLVLLKCVNRSDLWPCQFSICYIQKISRHWIILNHTSIWLTIVCCCHHHFNFVPRGDAGV